jgi:predicted Zn-dependent protease
MNARTSLQRLLPALLAGLALSVAAPAPARAEFSKDEIKMGQEGAKEVEKETKVVTDEAITKRVNDIGQALVKVSSEPNAQFTFKVLNDDKQVNAFALPGGFVFVYTGLLKKVESDDELAGVLAHEITHATHHHTLQLLKKQRPWDLATMGVILAGVMTGKDVSGLAQGVNILQTAKLNGYTIDLEKDADAGGMDLMLKSKYNPVGMFTFMDRLARDEAHSGSSTVEWGIFRTHPYGAERSAALRAKLEAAGIDINRRAVTKGITMTAVAADVKGQPAAVLKMADTTVATLAADGGKSAMDRATAVAGLVNKLLDDNLRFQEIAVSSDNTAVMGRTTPILRVGAADAKLAGETPAAVAADVAKQLRSALWAEFLRNNS